MLGVSLAEATTKLGHCQVRSKTGSPCTRHAEVEILGVAFCEPCAREQEAYFIIGELTQKEKQDIRGKALAEALKRIRRKAHTRSWSRGKRFESAHRLYTISLGKLNQPRRPVARPAG